MGDLLLARTDRLEATRRGGNAIVQFASPETRNSLAIGVLSTLESVISELERADPIGELVFVGSGDAFAAGADLNEISALSPDAARTFALRGQTLMNRIVRLGVLTTAVINGFCYGGGLDLALSCDKRISSANATFCHPGAGLGIITGWGGTQRLPRLVGQAIALEMFFTAQPIDARRALAIGLIDAIDDAAVKEFC